MPKSKSRPDPTIPDHEVLRKIGGGAYGEVWLARGVTGALRAVKVVWREDFDDERGFEREFEGILKFEPISRDHPGLVNILHVGRSPDGVSFYYYVMELGDDVRAGQDINPIEYEPRTLRADTRQAPVPAMEAGQVIEVGVRLAEALHHLHERGLAHRDVKPSNVIFVNGRAKLADIGLVAARDQRTFVGTEGFVPPEGPGSAQADVYSLGKVLYELATGKDRLDFPELPDELPAGGDRKRWLELNRIICEVCEPRISKRKIRTAAELAQALRRLQRGKRRRSSGTAVWATTMILLGFAAWAGWFALKDTPWLAALFEPPPPPPPAQPAEGTLRVISTPQDADVYDEHGNFIDITPVTLKAPVGREVRLVIRKPGFREQTVTAVVQPSAVNEPQVVWDGELEFYAPPDIGRRWRDHLGFRYQPVGEEHIGSGFVTARIWRRFLDEAKRTPEASETLEFSEDGEAVEIVLAPRDEAIAFADWLQVGARKAGYLSEDHEMLPQFERSFQHPDMSERARVEGLRPFRVKVREIDYGSIRLATEPPGADVYLNGVYRGETDEPLDIGKVKPGKVSLVVALDGYRSLTKDDITISAGERLTLNIPLERNQGVVFGKPWENGIGMRFAPLRIGPDQDLMVSIWETRVQDYRTFVAESGHPPPPEPDFPQDPDHPVVNVTRDDAIAFCKWLTRREIDQERITTAQFYRLPTDLEWSRMAGIEEVPGRGPGWRDARKDKVFPWGNSWPPPENTGNYADAAAAMASGVPPERTIPRYEDGFTYTSPVGSFPPNANGVHDLSGNVHEWVEDPYSELDPNRLGVVRGGGWNSYRREHLYIGSRNAVPPTFLDRIYGFRVVLVKDRPRQLPRSPEVSLDSPAATGEGPPSDG